MAQKNEVAQATPMDMAINNKFIDQLGTQLREKEKLGLSFPKNYSVENALNAAYLMLQDMTWKDKNNGWKEMRVLDTCTKQSIASSLMDMAVQALNPIKKQCYFVKFGNKLTLMRSYQGTQAVAKRCGVNKIVAEVIYEGDTFYYHIENGYKVLDKHEQDFMNIDNEKIKGAYAVLTLDDGTTYLEIMNINQIMSAWKKGSGYKDEKKGEGVHYEFADQMAKKTVINRACKNFINSSDDSDILEAFNSTTENEYVDPIDAEVEHDIVEIANSVDFEEDDAAEAEVIIDAEAKDVKAVKSNQKSEDGPGF